MSVSTGKRRGIRRVAIVAKPGPEGVQLADDLRGWLGDREIEVRFDSVTSEQLDVLDGFAREELPPDCDLAIVAGGDGTLLAVARAATPRGIPIFGVNFGGLGFLTSVQPDELYHGLERVLAGEYEIDERYALQVRYMQGEHLHSEHVLLNDAVITKSALARMVKLDLRIDDSPVATYTSDGLIVATPTGSTAYNLSAGGPILDPRMSAFVIAPICPHSMTHRPLVVPGSVSVEVTLRATDEEVYLTLDGQIGFPMESEGSLIVTQYARPVQLVRLPGSDFFRVLRRKLRWGER
jgi:NAD+ kinase